MRRSVGGRALLSFLAATIGAAAAARGGYDIQPLNIPGSVDTEPYGISSSRQVTGLYGDASGAYHGFTYQNGTLTTIDVPAALNATATNLFQGNDAGVIAGGYADANGIYHAALYNSANATWTYLAEPNANAQFNEAGAINNAGQVFGNWADNPTSTNFHAWLYQNGQYTFFDDPNADPSTGTITYGANNKGDVVGYYANAAGAAQGYIYHSATNTFTEVDVPNSLSTALFGINDNGDVVGRYRDLNNVLHGFLLSSNGVLTTIDDPAHANTYLLGISNAGDISGYSFDDPVNGPFVGFVSFVPEPSSLVLTGLGALALAGLAARSRRSGRTGALPEGPR